MTTTLEEYANARRGNYCTLPTIDVEILPNVKHCETCGREVAWVKTSFAGMWAHVEDEQRDGEEAHIGRPRAFCVYCHNDEPGTVEFRQLSWSDEMSCSRCGGVDGRAIGD